MLQQETLDPVPDEGPHDIEKENPAGDTPQDVATNFVLAEKPAGAVRQHRKQPEGRQRGVEHQRAAKDAMCGAQPGVCRIGRGGVAIYSNGGIHMRNVSRSLVSLAAVFVLMAHLAGQTAAPVYVTLWFDTEDYILPQDDDMAKRLAELLTSLGVRATFKVVGEKARVLEARGRRDVIAALKRHDIGYHSNTHSQQPTVAVYLQNAGWDEGRAEFTRREGAGVKDIQRIFSVTPVAYGQPGSA